MCLEYFLGAALLVEFTELVYTVDEEELVANVCITAAAQILQRNVSISLTSSEDSAIGLHSLKTISQHLDDSLPICRWRRFYSSSYRTGVYPDNPHPMPQY